MVTSLMALVGISCTKSLSQTVGLSKRIPLLLLLGFVRWRLRRKTDSLIGRWMFGRVVKCFYFFERRCLCHSCAETILCQVEADQGAQICHEIQRQ